jgi:hypothetical protein
MLRGLAPPVARGRTPLLLSNTVPTLYLTQVGHLFRLRLRLGYFDPPEATPWGNASRGGGEVVCIAPLPLFLFCMEDRG